MQAGILGAEQAAAVQVGYVDAFRVACGAGDALGFGSRQMAGSCTALGRGLEDLDSVVRRCIEANLLSHRRLPPSLSGPSGSDNTNGAHRT